MILQKVLEDWTSMRYDLPLERTAAVVHIQSTLMASALLHIWKTKLTELKMFRDVYLLIRKELEDVKMALDIREDIWQMEGYNVAGADHGLYRDIKMVYPVVMITQTEIHAEEQRRQEAEPQPTAATAKSSTCPQRGRRAFVFNCRGLCQTTTESSTKGAANRPIDHFLDTLQNVSHHLRADVNDEGNVKVHIWLSLQFLHEPRPPHSVILENNFVQQFLKRVTDLDELTSRPILVTLNSDAMFNGMDSVNLRAKGILVTTDQRMWRSMFANFGRQYPILNSTRRGTLGKTAIWAVMEKKEKNLFRQRLFLICATNRELVPSANCRDHYKKSAPTLGARKSVLMLAARLKVAFETCGLDLVDMSQDFQKWLVFSAASVVANVQLSYGEELMKSLSHMGGVRIPSHQAREIFKNGRGKQFSVYRERLRDPVTNSNVLVYRLTRDCGNVTYKDFLEQVAVPEAKDRNEIFAHTRASAEKSADVIEYWLGILDVANMAKGVINVFPGSVDPADYLNGIDSICIFCGSTTHDHVECPDPKRDEISKILREYVPHWKKEVPMVMSRWNRRRKNPSRKVPQRKNSPPGRNLQSQEHAGEYHWYESTMDMTEVGDLDEGGRFCIGGRNIIPEGPRTIFDLQNVIRDAVVRGGGDIWKARDFMNDPETNIRKTMYRRVKVPADGFLKIVPNTGCYFHNSMIFTPALNLDETTDLVRTTSLIPTAMKSVEH
eukprot:s3183_g3.t1